MSNNVIRKATNRWTKGLVMDFSPENTRNEVLTNALNATLLTFNGNELSLQNDMGNARVETSYLPEGYIPVGTCEYGGIIYIVSYNPLEDKSQIGCFPSPERNISITEIGLLDLQISNSDFQLDNAGKLNYNKKILLKEDKLNPGDKFVITSSESIYKEAIKDMEKKQGDIWKPVDHPVIKLSIVSIEDTGKIIYLDSELRDYVSNNYKYHILGSENAGTESTVDIDSYRNVLSSGYNVFKSKTSGLLCLLAELVMIDEYSVTHEIKPDSTAGKFKVFINTEVSPEVNQHNYTYVPKLKYYYLAESNVAFNKNANENISETSILKDIYYYPEDISKVSQEEDKERNMFIKDTILFPDAKTYHQEGGNFLPTESNGYKYQSVLLGAVTIPPYAYKYGNLDIPCTYTYSLVPCMSYGKLEHLKVTNTIDFNKLNDFNKSSFNVWKYFVEDGNIKLTFGAEIYDTFETYKVDGLVLEFYDDKGCVGSLKFTGKKSYSGIFNKQIALNTENTLNKIYANNNEINCDNEEDNSRLGILEHNLLYGVKTYFTRNNGTDIIPKETFFMFTFPIYNQYYYTVSNFNTITNPELDLVLTYKLQEVDSEIKPYSGEGITDGYTNDDKILHLLYINAEMDSNSAIEVTKYYQYSGTNKLQLEIGLKEDYSAYGLSYDPAINEKFTCTVELVGNSEKSVVDISSTNEEVSGKKQILNTTIAPTLKFGNEDTSYPIKEGFEKYNFITDGTDSIVLNYDFVVGYKININNLQKVSIPVTTVCALCHLRDDGTWNYEDFGIYEKTSENADGNITKQYLSNCVFCSSGTYDNCKISIGKLINVEGSNKGDLITLSEYIDLPTVVTKTPGKLYQGEGLKWFKERIGKLQFQQPHSHGLYSTDYTSLEKHSDKMYISYGDLTFHTHHYNNPLFNMCVNTKNSVDYNTDFISTMNLSEDTLSNLSTEDLFYEGLTAEQIEQFNKCLINTMKSVYAYNPDYNTIESCRGNISVLDWMPIFTSNLISKEAQLSKEFNINEHIYLHTTNTKYSDYLSALSKYLPTTVNMECVKFKYNLDYCGKDLYLISELTYNVPIPNNLTSNWEGTSYPGILIRHSDGSVNTIIVDKLNTKSLYMFENNTLLSIYTGNYLIDRDGNLTYNQVNNVPVLNSADFKSYTYQDNKKCLYYAIAWGCDKYCLVNSTIRLEDLLYEPNIDGHRLFIKSGIHKPLRGLINEVFVRTSAGILYRATSEEGDYEKEDHNTLFLYNGPSYRIS